MRWNNMGFEKRAARVRPAGKRKSNCERRVSVGVIVLALTLWVAVTESGLIAELFLPSPFIRDQTGRRDVATGYRLTSSSRRILIGYSVGTVAATSSVC